MKIFLLVLLLFNFGCTKEKFATSSYKELALNNSKVKLNFPEKLFTLITEKDFKDYSYLSKYEMFDPLPMSLTLVADNPGVMNEKSYQVKLNSWGGDVNFAKFIPKSSKGSIKLNFILPELKKSKKFKVYFLSWGKTRKIVNEEVGLGCNKVVDITDAFNKEYKDKGFVLHTAFQRHLSAIAGRFYFLNYTDKKIVISQISFLDSRYSNAVCGG